MSNLRDPEVDVDALLQRTRATVARRLLATTTATDSREVPTEPAANYHKIDKPQSVTFEKPSQGRSRPEAIQLKLPLVTGIVYKPTFKAPVDGRYRLKDLFEYHDRDFVFAAYAAVLRRTPDEEGLANYLAHIRSGMSKLEIVCSLRESTEGRKVAAPIAGLTARHLLLKVSRWPLLGSVLRRAVEIWRLPDTERQRRALLGQTISRMEEGQVNTRDGQLAVHVALHDFQRSHLNLIGYAHSKADRDAVARVESLISRLNSALTSLEAVVETKANGVDLQAALRQLRHSVQDLKRSKADIADVSSQETQLREVSAALHVLNLSKTDGELFSRLEEKHDQLSAELRFFAKSKMDRSGLDEVRQQLVSALDLRPQRYELAELRNHLMASLQTRAAREDIQPLEQAIRAVSEQSHENRALVETSYSRLQGAIDNARSDAKALVETEMGGVRSAIDGIARRQGAMSTEENHVLDDMYARFEDRFRGSRADIKQRATIYLPLIRGVGAGTAKAPVVDLGCGRGEWLELLGDEGLVGRGVDLNRNFLASCREMNFDVTEADAVSYLRTLGPQSIGAITSFHVIEHLSLIELVELLDEALRVLKPGGIVILETPNPENLQVGGCNFYTDPTHRNPLPPLLTEALLELRGFVRPSIIRRDQERLRELAPLHVASDQALAANINPMVEVMLSNFFVSPDYAVVGTKG